MRLTLHSTLYILENFDVGAEEEIKELAKTLRASDKVVSANFEPITVEVPSGDRTNGYTHQLIVTCKSEEDMEEVQSSEVFNTLVEAPCNFSSEPKYDFLTVLPTFPQVYPEAHTMHGYF